jgi:hypothetical protein
MFSHGGFPPHTITAFTVILNVEYSLESPTRQKEIAVRYLQPGRRIAGGFNAEDMT